MTGDKIELLAPAGNWEAFLAAVENGADAVYLGGKLFNARQNAGNFDSEQLKKALDYAHLRNVKVHLAMNTLINDSEIKDALEQVEEAYKLGIDAMIVQDMGFAGLVREVFPGLELHASTQMTVYNIEGVKALEKLGFKRAVLARELSLEEIGHIAKATPLEIEVFIHGALCISYSGQCLMSSVIGGRSGNRGKCAQPCRLKYELMEESRRNSACSGYIMSPKDICSINDLDKLVNTGVKSLKIEGRMKTPEYVATVVRIYRKYIDFILEGRTEAVKKEDMKELAQIFNRGGFSKGYLKGKTGRDMMSYEKPKNWGIYLGEAIGYDKKTEALKINLKEEISIGDGIEVWSGEEESPGTIVTDIKVNGKRVPVAKAGEIAVLGRLRGKIPAGSKVYRTSEKRLNAAARESFEGRGIRKSQISGYAKVVEGEPLSFGVKDRAGNAVEGKGSIAAQKAINKPLTRDRLLEQLSKTGNTPFEISRMDIKLEDGLSLPVSEINNLRRTVLELLEEKVAGSFEKKVTEEMLTVKNKLLDFPGNSRKESQNTKISLFMYSYDEKYGFGEFQADRIYLPFSSIFKEENIKRIEKEIKRGSGEVFLWLPNVTRGNYDRLIKSGLSKASELGLDGIMLGNVGQLDIRREFPKLKAVGDYTLNTFNSFSLRKLSESGLQGSALSLELTLAQIEKLERIEGFLKEAVVYGRISIMTSEYCPAGSIEGGHGSKNKCRGVCTGRKYRLKDRKGMEFPLLCDKIDCRSILLNNNVIFAAESVNKIATEVDIIRINVFDESPEQVKRLIQLHRDLLEKGPGVLGKYGELVAGIKAGGYTKGHYFRGV